MGGCAQFKNVSIPIPQFSTSQVLESADDATKERIKFKAASVVLSRLQLIDSSARYVGESQFELQADKITGESKQVVDLRFWSIQGVTQFIDGMGRELIIVTFYRPSMNLHYGESPHSSSLLNTSQGGGGVEGALEFIEACEVLGVKIRR
jgi:hypothetical protein